MTRGTSGGSIRVSPEQLPAAVESILADYSVYITDLTKAAVKEVTKETSKVTKKAGTYQNRRPKYRQSIAGKTHENTFGAEGIVYARNHEYSLTHLLENGHKLWQAPSVRTRAFKHWKVGEQFAQTELPKKILEKL